MLSLRTFSVLLVILAVVSLSVGIPEVHAQTTAITNVQFPNSVIMNPDGSVSPPLVVDATISYSSAGSEYILGTGVYDLTKSTTLSADGTASSSPDSCAEGTGTIRTFCAIYLKSSSGVETMHFTLSNPVVGTWQLSLGAILASSNPMSIITSSFSTHDFSIQVSKTVSLSVRAPYSVSVTVDGVKQSPGNVFLNVNPGAHEISIPAMVQVDNTTRLRFDRWMDGLTETDRTINLQYDMTYEATYVPQHVLALVTSQGNATGSGWYDEGSSVKITSPAAVPMAGIIGNLGGKWTFQGWYENGKLVTTLASSSITMDRAHVLTAHWNLDYLIPIAILCIVAVAAVGSAFGYYRYFMGGPTLKPRKARRPRRKKVTDTTAHIEPSVPPPEPSQSGETSVPSTPTLSGRRKTEEGVENPPSTAFCRHCGAEILGDSVFCSKCGKKLT